VNLGKFPSLKAITHPRQKGRGGGRWSPRKSAASNGPARLPEREAPPLSDDTPPCFGLPAVQTRKPTWILTAPDPTGVQQVLKVERKAAVRRPGSEARSLPAVAIDHQLSCPRERRARPRAKTEGASLCLLSPARKPATSRSSTSDPPQFDPGGQGEDMPGMRRRKPAADPPSAKYFRRLSELSHYFGSATGSSMNGPGFFPLLGPIR
jgi:hypothetical protein